MVKIPTRFEDLYPSAAIEKVMDALQHPDLSGRVREALGKVGIRDVNPLEQVQNAWQQARHWIGALSTDPNPSASPVIINATGQLFGPIFGRVPMAAAVAQTFAVSLSNFQAAETVATNAQSFTTASFGSMHTCWFSNTPSAMHALLGPRNIIVAKTDCVRIPGLADVGDVLKDMSITEVGATNGALPEDWEQSLRMQADRAGSCVLLVSPNGLDAQAAQGQREDAIRIAKKFGVAVFELLADGVLNETIAANYGFPLVKSHLETGVDAAIVPLNLLLAGPAGAMVIGKEEYIQALQRRALRNGTSLQTAELGASLLAMQVHRLGEAVGSGLMATLSLAADNLRDRAKRIAIQLNGNGVIASAGEIARASVLGPAPWNRYQLSNWAVEAQSVEPARDVQSRLMTAMRLESGANDSVQEPPIACGIEGDRLILDLRFVDPKDDHRIVQSLSPKSHSTDTKA